ELAADGGDLANEDVPDNLVLARDHEQGNADGAIASAAVTVSGRFLSGRSAAVPIEPRGCIAEYDWTTQHLTVWSSTQLPHFFRSMIAAFTGFPEHALEVIAPDVGGGFGQKCHLFPEELVVPLLARELGRPVKWIEDRVENLMTGTHAKQQLNEMEIAFDEGGSIVGLRQHVIGDGGAYNCFPWTALIEPMTAAGTVTSVYHIENIKTRFEAVLTNKVPIGACRGIGWQSPQIARECLLDQAARKLKLSPFELRKRNVVKPEQFPYTTATGTRFSEGSYLESIEALEEAIDYEEFRARQQRERERGRYLPGRLSGDDPRHLDGADGALRESHGVHLPHLAGPGTPDCFRADSRRRTGSAARGCRRPSRRHTPDLRFRHLGEPRGRHRRWVDPACGRADPSEAPADCGSHARGVGRRSRARKRANRGEGVAGQGHGGRRRRRSDLFRSAGAATGHGPHPGVDGCVRSCRGGVGKRRACGNRRRRRGDRACQDRAVRRRGGLRHSDQSDNRRGPAPRRDCPGDRGDVPRRNDLRRGGPVVDDDVH